MGRSRDYECCDLCGARIDREGFCSKGCDDVYDEYPLEEGYREY